MIQQKRRRPDVVTYSRRISNNTFYRYVEIMLCISRVGYRICRYSYVGISHNITEAAVLTCTTKGLILHIAMDIACKIYKKSTSMNIVNYKGG